MMDSELTNRQIAERLGMPLREYRRVQFADGTFSSYEQDIPEYGFRNWTGSTDAALTLPLEPDMYYLLEVPGEDSGARCAIWNQHPRSTNRGRLREVEVAADTPAAAVCAAWWAWKDAQEAR